MKAAKPATKTFSDTETSLFTSYEAKFLDFLEKQPESALFSRISAAKAQKKHSNFAARGISRTKTLIFSILTGKSAKVERNQQKSAKSAMFRAHSAIKHEFHKLFQYRYYSFSLRRIKKRAFFNLLATIKQFNQLYNEICAAFDRENMSIYREKLVFISFLSFIE